MRHPYKSEESKQRALSKLKHDKPHTDEGKANIKTGMLKYWAKRREDEARNIKENSRT